MNESHQNWYNIRQIENIDTPALVVYPERVKANIEAAVQMVKDPARLRPHVKTNKTIEVTQMMMEAGISKFKCATIAEMEMLALAGAKDVLLSYQPVGPKIKRMTRVIKSYPDVKFACLIDHPDAAAQLAQAMKELDIKLPVYLDLNVGTNRTGISPGEEALDLYESASKMQGISMIGLHIYDGHFRQKDIKERKAASDEAFAPVEAMVNTLKDKGYSAPVVVAGGTPTFPIHLQRENVICSPGTFVYWDAGYAAVLPEQPFNFAALVVTRVISFPEKGLICLDLGHKSIAGENPLADRVRLIGAEHLQPVSQSEEHLVMKTDEDHNYQIGDVLYGVPFHICPTVALYERVWLVKGGELAGEWKVIARNRKLNF